MKYLVETTGPFMLQDFLGRQQVEAWRPCVVRPTAFIENMRGRSLKVLEELSDEADDETLANAADLDEAIAALPRNTMVKKPHPLDHDGDGRPGGSKPKPKGK